MTTYNETLATAIEFVQDVITSEELEGTRARWDYAIFEEAIHEAATDNSMNLNWRDTFNIMLSDGIGLEFNDSDLVPDTRNVTEILQARIYEQLLADLSEEHNYEWFEPEEEDEEEDEEEEVGEDA